MITLTELKKQAGVGNTAFLLGYARVLEPRHPAPRLHEYALVAEMVPGVPQILVHKENHGPLRVIAAGRLAKDQFVIAANQI